MLFADLVGFTARSERMDPEDVQRLLQPYHAHLRSVLERHGGGSCAARNPATASRWRNF